MYIRKKPANKQNQINHANDTLLWIIKAYHDNDSYKESIRVNALEYFIEDYIRNYYDDQIFDLIIESIEEIHNRYYIL